MKFVHKKSRIPAILLMFILLTPSICTKASSEVLKKGMRNNAVLELQEKLLTIGQFKSHPTGYFGDITESSIKAFQKSCRLVPDGIAGRLTLAALDKSVKSKSTYIVIDPGHGGEDLGTVSGRLYEKNINLDIAYRVKNFLSTQKYGVLLTRNKDVSLADRSNIRGSFELKDLHARTSILNSSRAALFISIHVDSLPSEPEKNGSMVYYNPEVQGSEELARKLQTELNKVTANGKKRDSNTPSSADFYILKNAEIPGVLVESGFLTNSTDKLSLQKAAFKDEVAKAISKGIDEYFK